MKRLRVASIARGDDTTLSRWVKTVRAPDVGLFDALPRATSPRLESRRWVAAGVSKFHDKGVLSPGDSPSVLVSGYNNAKIGRDVRKGRFRGYWIYTLTLEERATCPRSCFYWATCYGNNMPFARRFDHRDQGVLQAAIERDVLRLLAVRGRAGVLVRLHALGDFFAPSYVEFWQTLLALHPRLAVYGYTAWPPSSDIGAAVARAKALYDERFAVRWSNGSGATDCAIPAPSIDAPVNAIVCPEQTGRTAACATCGLCWSTRRNVAFLEH